MDRGHKMVEGKSFKQVGGCSECSLYKALSLCTGEVRPGGQLPHLSFAMTESLFTYRKARFHHQPL